MTTHQLAGLLDSLRSGMTSVLKADGVKEFEETAAAFREQPDQPLKEFVKQIRKSLASQSEKSAGTPKKVVVDVNAVIERIRRARTGGEPFEPMTDLDGLTDLQLKNVLAAFGGKGTSGKTKNLERVKALLPTNGQPTQDANPPSLPVTSPTPTATDLTLVEQGVRLFQELKADPNVTVLEVRSRMAPIRQYPKLVVEEISRRVGYTPDDSRDKTFDRMLSNLVEIKMSQLRSKMILN